jgi:hypothetical protein
LFFTPLGKDWLEAVAYEQAEEMLMDLGATHAVTGEECVTISVHFVQ